MGIDAKIELKQKITPFVVVCKTCIGAYCYDVVLLQTCSVHSTISGM